jgi:hypothetical protein
VPNLKADRLVRMAVGGCRLNVRRLMYQTLICAAVLRYDARGLRAPFDTKNVEGLADALVNGVGRNLKASRDLLRREMLVYQAQAIELPGA